ncbi:MAG: hypothetical protein JWM11_7712 [Planctomycetaceae bacterium]|nr:hypothetical protein [Planctomycetaceae bacterium]
MIRRYVRATVVAFCLAAMIFGSLGVGGLQAQETKKKPSKSLPFLVVCAASFDRLMDDADYMFEVAGRPEISEVIGGALAGARDLKGLNRDSSAGLLLFLDGLTPEPIGYVPVKDIDEMMKTITIGPVTTNKKEEGLYEIRGPNQSLFAKVVGDYAFIGRSEASLDKDLSNPAQYTRRLSASYDLAVSLNLRAIPKASRDLLLDFLRASTETQLQQRDDEPDAAFRVRKAGGMANLESLEMFLTQAEEATIGFNVSAEEKDAYAEIVITADPKSEYAKLLNELGASRSQFTSLLATPASMTASASLKIDKNGRNFLKELLTVAQGELVKDLAKPKDSEEAKASPIAELFQSIQTTVTDGKLDFIVQLLGDPPGPFTLVGGVKIAEADHFNSGLAEIFGKLKDRSEFEKVETKVAEHRGVTLNRLQVKNIPDAAVRIFGKDHGLYVGAGNGALWFSIGAEDGLPTLKKVIDKVADAPVNDNPVTPAQFVLHLSSWLGMMERPDGSADAIVELMRDSFAQGGGTIRAELKPITNGMQARLTFDEGFIKLVGKAIGKRMDDRKN